MGCSASSSQSQIHPKRGGLGDSTSHRVRVTGLSNDGQLLMDNSLREQSRLDISVAAAHVPSVNRLSPRGPNPRLRKKAEGNEEDPAYMEQLNQALIQSLMEHELNEGEERMIKEVLKISEFEHKKNEFDFKEIKKGKVLSKAQKDTLTELVSPPPQLIIEEGALPHSQERSPRQARLRPGPQEQPPQHQRQHKQPVVRTASRREAPPAGPHPRGARAPSHPTTLQLESIDPRASKRWWAPGEARGLSESSVRSLPAADEGQGDKCAAQ